MYLSVPSPYEYILVLFKQILCLISQRLLLSCELFLFFFFFFLIFFYVALEILHLVFSSFIRLISFSV